MPRQRRREAQGAAPCASPKMLVGRPRVVIPGFEEHKVQTAGARAPASGRQPSPLRTVAWCSARCHSPGAAVATPRCVVINDVTCCVLRRHGWQFWGSNSYSSQLAPKASASTCSCKRLSPSSGKPQPRTSDAVFVGHKGASSRGVEPTPFCGRARRTAPLVKRARPREKHQSKAISKEGGGGARVQPRCGRGRPLKRPTVSEASKVSRAPSVLLPNVSACLPRRQCLGSWVSPSG